MIDAHTAQLSVTIEPHPDRPSEVPHIVTQLVEAVLHQWRSQPLSGVSDDELKSRLLLIGRITRIEREYGWECSREWLRRRPGEDVYEVTPSQAEEDTRDGD